MFPPLASLHGCGALRRCRKRGGANAACTLPPPIEDFIRAQGSEACGVPAPYKGGMGSDPESGPRLGVDRATNQRLARGAIRRRHLARYRMEGTIIDRPLPNGWAEIAVLRHAKNAYTFALVPSDAWCGWDPRTCATDQGGPVADSRDGRHGCNWHAEHIKLHIVGRRRRSLNL